MASKETIGAVVIPLLIQCIKSRGVTPAEIELQTGIGRETLNDPDIRIPIDQHLKLWEFACEVTGDPSLPINLREEYGNARIHFVNTLATNSSNALEGVNNWKRYGKIVSEAIQIDLSEEGDIFKIMYSISNPYHLNPWMSEHAFFQVVKFCIDLIDEEFIPLEVTFRHSCTSSVDTYEKFFRAPVKFDQPENAIIVNKDDLKKPILGSNPHLQKILKQQADQELEKMKGGDSVVYEVKQMIGRQLATGELDIESVAEALNMSRTTLYRKLKAESTSYNELLTDIRKEFVKVYMRNGMNISQMSFLLGYSTASNFMIAFKRWFGETPGSYRHSVIGLRAAD